MNRRQRIAIFLGTVMVAVMLLFPPMKGWRSGYGFPFNKRSTYLAEFDTWVSWRINHEMLVLQIVIVAVLISGVIVLLGNKRN